MSDILGIAWENIFIGLLGGFVVTFVTYIVKYSKDKMIEKKYPVSGEYITTYDDLLNGEIIEKSAIAKLKQNGNKIKGETWFEDNKKWIIDCDINENGYISGIYYAENPLDKGIGNIFLRIDNSNNMYGLWSGFDSDNGIISSGKYSFKPILRTYAIGDMRKEHITQVLEIADYELGKNYINYNEIDEFISLKSEYICKVAVEGKKVLGFCICKRINLNDTESYLKLDKNQIPRYVGSASGIGVIKTVAVNYNNQFRGIGHKLVKSCYDILVDMDVQCLCSVAWKNNDKINIHGILNYLGFKKHNEIERFWEEDSIEYDFSCPACGEAPCRCSAVIYFKAI